VRNQSTKLRYLPIATVDWSIRQVIEARCRYLPGSWASQGRAFRAAISFVRVVKSRRAAACGSFSDTILATSGRLIVSGAR
jgi:hypothetical protein